MFARIFFWLYTKNTIRVAQAFLPEKKIYLLRQECRSYQTCLKAEIDPTISAFTFKTGYFCVLRKQRDSGKRFGKE